MKIENQKSKIQTNVCISHFYLAIISNIKPLERGDSYRL